MLPVTAGKIQGATALSKHWALPCAKCLRARGVFLAPTVLRLGFATMTLRWVPTQLSGATRHRFALLGSAVVQKRLMNDVFISV